MAAGSKPFLLFDFDGTLANTFAFGVEIFNELAPQYQLGAITLDRVQELRKLSTEEILDHLGISRGTALKMGVHIRKVLQARMEEVEPVEGTREALLSLHLEGFRMGILSSNSVGNIRLFLNRLDLQNYFSFVEAGVSLFGKSTRISKVLRQRSLSPGEVLYVGDETRDMEAAEKAGVATVGVCWGANERAALEKASPDYCIDEPGELLRCVREFGIAG